MVASQTTASQTTNTTNATTSITNDEVGQTQVQNLVRKAVPLAKSIQALLS